jgi:3-dehydroquinate synthase
MKIKVDLGDRGYDIIIERGALGKIGELFDLGRRVLVVTDEGVPCEYAKAVADASESAVIVTVGEGEGSRSFPVFEKLCRTMLDNGFTRGDCVVAVGGGVVGDLSGFAAASYMRGIDFYISPPHFSRRSTRRLAERLR